MRICLVLDYLPGFHSTYSGAEILGKRLGEMLEEEGHEVCFITAKMEGEEAPKGVYQIPRPRGGMSSYLPLDLPRFISLPPKFEENESGGCACPWSSLLVAHLNKCQNAQNSCGNDSA